MRDGFWRRLWVRLTCWDACPFIFRHKEIRVVQEFGRSARKLRCDRCGKYFAMSDEHQAVLPWDEEFEDLYANMFGFGRTIR
jgi:hypothetical protein